jgi:putative IMPACT (imprinted ancient) family translation regulator
VLHLMQLMDIWDVMVVVTRWYGGHQLGPKRFSIINTVARDAFVRAGFVKEVEEGRKKGKR